MSKTTAGVLAAIMFSTTSSGALAQSLTWRVSESAGAVSIRHGAETRPATRNATLTPGDAVVTGAGGRAVLVHDRDFVTVNANSRVTVPQAEEATGFVKIIQNVGNAIFRIEKLGVPHFGVKTPYLAAVVKGTTFSVTVDPTGTSLQVTEGAVEVATLDGGAKDLIRPGSVATIGAGDLYRLQVQGDSARTIDSPSRPVSTGAVPAATVVAVNAPAPVAATEPLAAAGPAPQAIGEAISSKPVDLGGLTGGMLTGTTAAAPAALLASVKVDAAAAAAAPTPPAETAAPPVAQPPAAAVTPPPAAAVTPPPAAVVTPPPVTSPPPPPSDAATDTKAQDKADKDAAKAADDAAKDADKADKDAAKAADDVAKDADKAAKDAEKAADKAAKDAKEAADKAGKAAEDAAKDAQKAADDLAKAQEKAANDAVKAAEDAKRAAEDAAQKAAKDAIKAAEELAKPDINKDPGNDGSDDGKKD